MNSNSSSIVISFSIAILLLLILLLLISYNSKCKMDNIERFENENGLESSISDIIAEENNKRKNYKSNLDNNPNVASADGSKPIGNIYPADPATSQYSSTSEQKSTEEFTNYESFNNNANNANNNTCFDRDRLTSSDLLPMDAANSKWAQINPAGSGMLGDQNFLTAGYHIGINTIGQSLRNANLQLRSEPPNPQVAVSPWGISTIEPDIRTTTLEIGSAPSY